MSELTPAEAKVLRVLVFNAMQKNDRSRESLIAKFGRAAETGKHDARSRMYDEIYLKLEDYPDPD